MRLIRRFAIPVILVGAAGCGGDSGSNNNGNTDTEQMAKANPSGDGQVADANTTLPNPFRIVITKAGAPVSGKTVTWQVTAGGGTVNPTTATTGNDGIASTVATLGTTQLTVTASADGVTGSPVTFGAAVIGLNATVSVANNSFTPNEVTIKTGGTVTFNWSTGATGHSVVPDDGKTIPDSGDGHTLRSAPFQFSATFNAPGDYYYHCSAHGGNKTGMFGRITVVP
jgi:plastocyanin